MKDRLSILKNVISTFLFVLFSFFFLSMVITRFVGDRIPNFLGYRISFCASESMEPTICTRDVIILKKISADKLIVGDIAGYKLNNRYILHRIININDDIFRFRGDNNNFTDNPVSKDTVHYKFIKKIPLGSLFNEK